MITKTWVKESKFGIWFLNTAIWHDRVLSVAIKDLARLLPKPAQPCRKILDVGCGKGNSFRLLEAQFNPETICGLEIDASLLKNAQLNAKSCHCSIELNVGNAEKMPYPDASFDMVFCHQSFHHIMQHELAMQEFYRVLQPGGVLLFAESCKKFIHSISIRLLFRHPMDVQKTAGEYLTLIRNTGFQVNDESISMPYLWWSRADLGAKEWFGMKVPAVREETLVNLVAIK